MMALENVEHGLVRDFVAQIGERPHRATTTPAVLCGYFRDQLSQFRVNSGSARRSTFLGAIELGSDEFAMPAHNGIRLGQVSDVFQALLA